MFGKLDPLRAHRAALPLSQILDTNPHSLSAGGWLEDVSLVKKYEISEEAYNKRESEFSAVATPLELFSCVCAALRLSRLAVP